MTFQEKDYSLRILNYKNNSKTEIESSLPVLPIYIPQYYYIILIDQLIPSRNTTKQRHIDIQNIYIFSIIL